MSRAKGHCCQCDNAGSAPGKAGRAQDTNHAPRARPGALHCRLGLRSLRAYSSHVRSLVDPMSGLHMCTYACIRSSTRTYGSRFPQPRSRLRLRLASSAPRPATGIHLQLRRSSTSTASPSSIVTSFWFGAGVLLRHRVTLRRWLLRLHATLRRRARLLRLRQNWAHVHTASPQPAPVVYMCMNAALAS
jgi:hypothetical protein